MSEESPVDLFDGEDPEMQKAHQRARKTFKYLWRELSWERRRIVPGLGLAAVKAPFSDSENNPNADDPQTEHMWMSDIDFDGTNITGELLNEPNWLKSVSAGDEVTVRLAQISDWMYSVHDRVYGAYTVNLMRSRMSRGERAEHDGAWGLDFGDPNEIELVPADWGPKPPGFFKRLFGGGQPADAPPLEKAEHPMSINMRESLVEFLTENPDQVNGQDEDGWTMLHREALAGNLDPVEVLLEHGADPSLTTNAGRTALQLAERMRWGKVVAALK